MANRRPRVSKPKSQQQLDQLHQLATSHWRQRASVPAADRGPLLPTQCVHPFVEMRVLGWRTNADGRELVLDAICGRCNARYLKGMVSAPVDLPGNPANSVQRAPRE